MKTDAERFNSPLHNARFNAAMCAVAGATGVFGSFMLSKIVDRRAGARHLDSILIPSRKIADQA
ncbi:MAG TPA: hypothetical protein VGI22_13555 [Xanthobacteraceae bacterium]